MASREPSLQLCHSTVRPLERIPNRTVSRKDVAQRWCGPHLHTRRPERLKTTTVSEVELLQNDSSLSGSVSKFEIRMGRKEVIPLLEGLAEEEIVLEWEDATKNKWRHAARSWSALCVFVNKFAERYLVRREVGDGARDRTSEQSGWYL